MIFRQFIYDDLGCARIVVSTSFRAFAEQSSNSWVRFRRAIFCFRFRLNLDLSSLSADIINSCHWDRS